MSRRAEHSSLAEEILSFSVGCPILAGFGFCKGGSFVFLFHRTDGTFPLSEKITAATQSSRKAIEDVPSVPRFPSVPVSRHP
jgi:hypothetical protein